MEIRAPYARSPESESREKRMRAEAPKVLERAGFLLVEDRSTHGMQFVAARSGKGEKVTAWVKCAWHPGKHGHCAVQLDFPPPDKRPNNDEEAVQLIADKARRAASRGATHVLLLAADDHVSRILAAYLMPIEKLAEAMQTAMRVDRNLVRNGHSPRNSS